LPRSSIQESSTSGGGGRAAPIPCDGSLRYLYLSSLSSGFVPCDGQATWHSINNGVEVGATSTFTAQELIDLGGAFNIRAKSAITLDRAIVRLV